MSFLSVKLIDRYLQPVRELGSSADLIDMHVHATEVIRGRMSYVGDPADVLSAPGSPAYAPAALAPLRLTVPAAAERLPEASRIRLSEGMFERSYNHTGARVMHDQMDLCGVSRVLLLPVATAVSPIDRQMATITAMRESSERILSGYAVPIDVPTAGIERHLRLAADEFGPVAIKLHPNLSAIDLSTAEGKDRVETILASCHYLNLPIVVHGGCSPILGDTRSARYAAIDELARIDWSITGSSVVIAHFGIYGCAGLGSQPASLKAVNRLLDRHSNLYLDTSGVGPELMLAALGQTDLDRLVFGSDALYLPIWQVLVSIMHALDKLGHRHPDRVLARMAVHNPARILSL